jgi:hypothetical protein
MQPPEEKSVIIREKRDIKAHDHLAQYAPVWLLNEEYILDEDSMVFNVLFMHPRYAWVNRRYRFDSYNNVLYYNGQILLDEDEALDVQSSTPFIDAEFVNSTKSYGG